MVMASFKSQEELTIIIIGKAGAGKSSIANTILGENCFETGLSGQPITKTCQDQHKIIFGRHIHIVDTPGLFEEGCNNDIMNKLKAWILNSTSGAHAILLAFEIGRFTGEDDKTVDSFTKFFGEKLKDYIYVVFTRFDDWKRSNKGKTKDFSNYINSLPPKAKDFLEVQCKNRYIPFDNTIENDESQVQMLLHGIDHMMLENNSTYYTKEDKQAADKKIEEEKKENERKIEELLRKEIYTQHAVCEIKLNLFDTVKEIAVCAGAAFLFGGAVLNNLKQRKEPLGFDMSDILQMQRSYDMPHFQQRILFKRIGCHGDISPVDHSERSLDQLMLIDKLKSKMGGVILTND